MNIYHNQNPLSTIDFSGVLIEPIGLGFLLWIKHWKKNRFVETEKLFQIQLLKLVVWTFAWFKKYDELNWIKKCSLFSWEHLISKTKPEKRHEVW